MCFIFICSQPFLKKVNTINNRQLYSIQLWTEPRHSRWKGFLLNEPKDGTAMFRTIHGEEIIISGTFVIRRIDG